MLSGFLITSLLVAENDRQGRVAMRSFYIRRALRLLPALIGVLAAHLSYTVLRGDSLGEELQIQAAILLYASNWVQAWDYEMPIELVHTWSLSVEEQFYLVWPALLLVLLGRLPNRKAVLMALAAGILMSSLSAERGSGTTEPATRRHTCEPTREPTSYSLEPGLRLRGDGA